MYDSRFLFIDAQPCMLEARVNASIIDWSTLTLPRSITCWRAGPYTAWNPLGDPCESHDHRSMPYPVSTVLIGSLMSWSPWTLYCMKTRVPISNPPVIVSKSGPAFPPPVGPTSSTSVYLMQGWLITRGLAGGGIVPSVTYG